MHVGDASSRGHTSALLKRDAAGATGGDVTGRDQKASHAGFGTFRAAPDSGHDNPA
jgi:hypothetical protein